MTGRLANASNAAIVAASKRPLPVKCIWGEVMADARREYEMTVEQHAKLLEACRPQMYLVANGTEPDVQGSILRAWDVLGAEMGFIGNTARPIPGKSDLFFTAAPTNASGEGR
jgi:hypothetical protein